jgi:hypothetical protein
MPRLLTDGRYRHPFYWAGFVFVSSTRKSPLNYTARINLAISKDEEET